jgi:hypothetical protein
MHLTPPVDFISKGHSYLILKPRAGIAYSMTLKKEWAHRKRNQWYAETGITTQGLRYYQNNLFGDSVTIWTDYNNTFIFYPTVLLGGGYQFGIGKKQDAIGLGLEGSFQIPTVVDIYSTTFNLEHHPIEDAVFPLFLRLNLAYKHPFYFGKKAAGQLQFYTLLSAQKVTQGTTTMFNPIEGGLETGRYSINNSELGVKVFIGLKPVENKFSRAADTRKMEGLMAAKKDSTRLRVSVYGQYFRFPETIFHIPQVDSFSLESTWRNFTTQAGVQVEIPLRKDPRWAYLLGLGIGQRVSSMRFISDGRFPDDGLPIGQEYNITYGLYGTMNVGMSRRSRLGRIPFSQALSLTLTTPLQRTNEALQVTLSSDDILFPVNPVLEGKIYGSASLIWGFEYNPEIVLPFGEHSFVALGAVFNWSTEMIGFGSYTVSNQYKTYYGDILQKFGKIGVSARIGLNR